MLGRDWLPSQLSSNICVDIGSALFLSPNNISSLSSSLVNGGRVESSSDSSLLSVLLQVYDSKFPSSNCADVIISPVFCFEDVTYGISDTSGRITIDY